MKAVTLISMMIFGLSMTAASQNAASRLKQFNVDHGLAISGYDPVAYFKLGKAVMGKQENSFSYQGITYYFSSFDNSNAFKRSPEKYEPEYGGWCAYAMGSKGEKVSIDPATFKISNGKLYLFYNRFFNNTLKDWNKDEARLKTKADANWHNLTN